MMLYKVTSLAFDPATRTAFYTNQNYAYRDLYAIDVDTGKQRKLLKDARIGDLAFDRADQSLWGIRHQNGFVTLVRIPAPYTSFNQIKTFRYGEVIFDLDVSPDGELISASYGGIDGKQSVKVWKRDDLMAGNAEDPVAALSLPPSVPENFTFTPDGKALLGNSYYTGAANVFRLDIATGKYDVLTNASTGFFRPQLRPDGTCWFTIIPATASIRRSSSRRSAKTSPPCASSAPRSSTSGPSSSNGASARRPRFRSTS